MECVIKQFNTEDAALAVKKITEGIKTLQQMGVRSSVYVFEGTGYNADMFVDMTVFSPDKYPIGKWRIKVNNHNLK